MDGSNFSIGRAIDKQVVIDRYYRPSTNQGCISCGILVSGIRAVEHVE